MRTMLMTQLLMDLRDANADSVLTNTILWFQVYPWTKLRGLLYLTKTGHAATLAPYSTDKLHIDGVPADWDVLIEWARRAPGQRATIRVTQERWRVCSDAGDAIHNKTYTSLTEAKAAIERVHGTEGEWDEIPCHPADTTLIWIYSRNVTPLTR